MALTACASVEQAARELGLSEPGGRSSPPRSVGSGHPEIRLSGAAVNPGGAARIAVSLHTGGRLIAGAQNDITLPGGAIAIASTRGKPDCSVNPGIGKGASAFAFLPSGCTGGACKGVRAIVLSMTDVRPIADGSELYSCRIAVAAGATAGEYALGVVGVALSTPDGKPVAARGVGATVTVR